jgi:hypothetical protein
MISDYKTHADNLIRVGILNIEDLKANQSGRLSDRQKHMLYQHIAFQLVLASLEIIILTVFLYFQIFIQGNLLIAIFGIILFALLIYMCLKEAEPFWKDLKNNKPKTASGRLYKGFRVAPGTPKGLWFGNCSIRIGKQVFSVSPSVYDCVIHEDLYRIYFVSNTRKIINIEPI